MDISEEQKKELEEKIKNMSPEELASLQKQQCVFCKIIAGDISSKKVYEDDKCVVILDINPASKGHCLIVPKKHYSIMPQIPGEELQHFTIVSKEISQILLKSMRCDGTNIFIANGQAAGQMAPHFMIHIIPRKEDDNVLNLEEHVIGLDDRKKIRLSVRNKFNELMNIKEDISDQEELTKHVEDNLNDEVNGLNSDVQGGSQSGVQEGSEDLEDSEDLDEKERSNESGPEKDGDTSGQEESQGNSDKDKTEVTLDDIANLFK